MEQLSSLIDVQDLMTRIVAFLPSLFAAILLFIAFQVAYRLTRKPLIAGLRQTNLQPKLIELMIESVYRYALAIFGLVMALDQLGVNVTAALAGIGVVGLALGFAAQDSVSNVIAGFLIFWDQPFTVGSWLRTEGQFGQVADITLRTTRIRTNQNTYVIIPNKNIINSVIENYTQKGEVRVDVPVGIAYKESISHARKVILDRLGSHMDWIRKDPAPDVVADALGDSSVNLFVRVWIDDPSLRPKTHCAVIEECKIALDEAGIEIPFPHLQLFLDNVEDRVWDRLAPALGGGSGSNRG
ncbi:MAG: mechanosensitive ion channel protein MscS [Gemmatimonadota bacterium]|nr:MAG: mechanosensitive ion channel protein MscS [Gemmatimonadota bacterium]